MSVLGFTGYNGGLPKLLVDTGTHRGALMAKALKCGVMHIGGPASHGQYYYTKFVHPIVKHAVDGGASRLVYFITEGSQTNGRKKYAPSSALVGDRDDVMKYLDVMMGRKRQLGVYYYHFDPTEIKGNVKCYLDFDFHAPIEDNWNKSYDQVYKAIELVNAGLLESMDLQGISHDDHPLTHVIAYNSRQVAYDERYHSFHVTWVHHGFASQNEQRDFMASQLRDHVDYDKKVYTNGRLMRMPWCGKNNNDDAVLLPITVTYNEVDGCWEKVVDSDVFDAEICEQFNICPYKWDVSKKYAFHNFVHDEVNTTVRRVGVNRDQPVQQGVDAVQSAAIFDFFEPLLRSVIIPAIQRHRRGLLAKLARGTSKAGVPVANFNTTQFTMAGWRTGVYLGSVTGDTFCEYDTDGATPYYHDQSKITLQINFKQGYYNQMCHACNPSVQNMKKYALFTPNDIVVGAYDSNSPRVLDVTKEQSSALFLRYFSCEIVFNPVINPDFFVYDAVNAVWVADKFLLTAKRNMFRDRYIAYRKAVYAADLEFRLHAAAGNVKKIAKIVAELKFIEAMQPSHLETTRFINDLQANYTLASAYSDIDMDPCPHLVPLGGNLCYNVLEDVCVPREKLMYFTSTLNASMKPSIDAECLEIKAWFLEVARGRVDLARYLKLVMGLCMTSLDIDRKFYCNLGVEGRNGKSVLFEIIQVPILPNTTQNISTTIFSDHVWRSLPVNHY